MDFYPASPNRIIKLEVYYKSKIIKEINNQDLRIDIFEKKIHQTENVDLILTLIILSIKKK